MTKISKLNHDKMNQFFNFMEAKTNKINKELKNAREDF